MTAKENGLLWTGLLGVYYGSSAVAESAFSKLMQWREKKGIPGLNSASLNREIWEQWDWDGAGEEWTISPEWKQSLVQHVLDKNVPADTHILEIGPGAGRWTDYLIPRAKTFTGLDISRECVRICAEKYNAAQDPKVDFRVTDGASLPGVEDASVDVIWSFDVFVHINRQEIEQYMAEFQRVLRPGGRVIIHHGSAAGEHGGWRSNMTGTLFIELLEAAGLQLIEQFQNWKDGDATHEVGQYKDLVTVFEKPQAQQPNATPTENAADQASQAEPLPQG
jgi:ubiquinone/menaquinone biosynthesis C-methylase UbiE